MNNKTILQDLHIITFFHPIISIKDNSIVAVEALSRFKINKNDELRPINLYMETIKKDNDLLNLDLKLIETAAQTFSIQTENRNNLLLFINLSSVIINMGISGLDHISKILLKSNISPNRVILEILEENLDNSEKSNNFFSKARDSGFSIALDDVGVGFSNLQRIAQVKPDIIKLDISIVTNIHNDYYKRKVFKSLTKLAHDIGSLVVAEGVENGDVTIKSLELGAGLLQGFYFCRPLPSIDDIFNICAEPIKICRKDFKKSIKAYKELIRTIKQDHIESVKTLSTKLSSTNESEFEKVITDHLESNSDISCIFIMDSEGIQVTNTVSSYISIKSSKNLLFKPAQIGADQSLKPYYLESQNIIESQVTEKYISQATGLPCRTFSGHFF